MADDVMAVDKRRAALEETVARGFSELGARIGSVEQRMVGVERRLDGVEQRLGRLDQRMGSLEDRMDAFNAKLDVVAESLEGKVQLVLDRVDAHAQEMRLTTRTIQREQRTDRRLMFSILRDHRHRIEALERSSVPERRAVDPQAP